MNLRKILPLLVIVLVIIVGLTQGTFMVYQTQAAMVLQLGKAVGDIRGPGLHFKIPFAQNVLFFDKRILEYDAPPSEILTSDKKTLVVDNFTKWRITDPLMFYRTVRTIPGAQARLDDIIYSQLRVSLGRHTLSEIVSSDRPKIMALVTERASKLIDEYGIEVVDVRIKRTDLPEQNERSIYGRMRAERERQAKQYRSEGAEEAAKIKSGANRERAVILAEAKRKAEVIRGEGDGQATKIYAQALKKSPEFYTFKRSLEAYVKSLKSNTRLVITPDSPFFKYFR